jgi:CheY-like chemotaxis protein
LEIRVATVEIQAARELTLGQLLPGSWVCLSIVDNGVGLRADQIESMFEPFYTTRQPGQGTGIGLTVVRNIVSRMHGALDVQSHIGSAEIGHDSLGSVTRISVYWPSIAPKTESAVSQNELPRTGLGETVMVVDDKPELVMLAEEVLASLGYEPVGFIGARTALAAFRRNPRRFDAILTDERMQSLRGCDLAKMIREIDPSVPVILLTGYRDADIDVRAKEAGIVAILDKPLHVQTLSAALRRQFNRPLTPVEA